MNLLFKSSGKITETDIETACGSLLLQKTMKGSLKSLPANIYWHYKMHKQIGVFEITWLLNEDKLMLNCKKNRMGVWINAAAMALIKALKLIELKNQPLCKAD